MKSEQQVASSEGDVGEGLVLDDHHQTRHEQETLLQFLVREIERQVGVEGKDLDHTAHELIVCDHFN